MFFLQMSGFPGSGKTTLSMEIARLTGAIVVDHDVSKSAILESIGDSGLDLAVLGRTSYQVDWATIDFLMSQGKDVIFDAPCLYEEMLTNGTQLCEKYKAAYKYVECYIHDYEEISRRLSTRVRKISQISGTEPEIFEQTLLASKKPTDHPFRVVETSQPLQNYVQEVLDYIQNQ